MKAHRNIVISSSIICVAFIILSLIITCISQRLPQQWHNLLLSLFAGVFASSFLVLVSEIINVHFLRKRNAFRYLSLIYSLKKDYSLLASCINYLRKKENMENIKVDDLPEINRQLRLISEVLFELNYSDPVSLFNITSTKWYSRYFNNSFSDLESKFFKNVNDILIHCESTYIHSTNIIYSANGEREESKTKFLTSLTSLTSYLNVGSNFDQTTSLYLAKLKLIVNKTQTPEDEKQSVSQ